MDKPIYCKKLPIGYRFVPSDVELLIHYLMPKILRLGLPAAIIPDNINVFHINPWDLPGDSREKRYFFCERGRKANRYKVLTGFGYWKATGKEEVIWDSGKRQSKSSSSSYNNNNNNKVAIGVKRKLTFYHEKQQQLQQPSASSGSTTTEWVMWEYRLVTSLHIPAYSNKMNIVIEEVGDWMVCCICEERRKPIIINNNNNNNNTKENENFGEINEEDDTKFMKTQNIQPHILDDDVASTSSCLSSLTDHDYLFSDQEATS